MKQIKRKQKGSSVASMVAREIDGDAHYRKAMELGIANLSAIAERIASKNSWGREAVKVAVARYASKYSASSANSLRRVQELLVSSRISLEDGIAVVVVDNSAFSRRSFSGIEDSAVKSVVSGEAGITIVMREAYLARAEKLFGGHLLLKSKGLCLIRLSSPEKIEEVEGVYAHILEGIARRGINVLETSSCYTETNIIVERKDALKCFAALEETCGRRSG